MKLFEVTAKCGHVGRNHFTVKTFAVTAESGKEAAAMVRMFPRVKHDQKYCILSVTPIDAVRFNALVRASHDDPYFSCRCIQDQRVKGYFDRFQENPTPYIERDDEPMRTLYYRKVALRHAKKYMNNYIDFESVGLERYAG